MGQQGGYREWLYRRCASRAGLAAGRTGTGVAHGRTDLAAAGLPELRSRPPMGRRERQVHLAFPAARRSNPEWMQSGPMPRHEFDKSSKYLVQRQGKGVLWLGGA